MASLEIEVGGRTFRAELPSATVRVGRGEDSDLRIDDPRISATQFTVEPFGEDGHLLVDANSGRPTRVNGAVVKRVALKPGDVVEVGAARLRYSPERAAPSPLEARAAPPPVAAAPPPPAAVPTAATPPPPSVAARAPRAVLPPVVPADAGVRVEGPSSVAEALPAPAADVAREPGEDGGGAPAARPRRPTRSLTGPLVGIGAVALLAIVAGTLLGRGSEDEARERAYEKKVERAADLRRRGDLRGAEVAYAEVARGPSGVPAVEAARRHVEVVRASIQDAERDFAALWDDRAALDPASARRRFDDLRVRHGDVEADRHADLLARLAAFRADAFEARHAEARRVAAEESERGDFAAAAAAWARLERSYPDEARSLAADGRSVVDARAAPARDALLARVDALAASKEPNAGPAGAASTLREAIARFEGTSSAAALRGRLDALESAPRTSVSTAAARPPPSTGPTPVVSPAAAAAVAAALAEADALAGGRRFRAALEKASTVVEAAPAGTAERSRVEARVADLRLAAEGLETLVRSIRESPSEFGGVEFNEDFRADVVAADAEQVSAAVPSGRVTLRWAQISPSAVAALVARARPAARGHLELAGLLHALGNPTARDRALVAHLKAGGDPAFAHATLARWRGEAVPAGGYVVHEGALVSPAERDRLVLEARIRKAAAQVGARDAKARAAAYEELLGLGEPARPALVKALRLRRKDAADEIAQAKVFTSTRTRTRLQEELERRRAAALALIEDPARYPYPSESHEGQAEVDRLVDLVREVWERPFDVVVAWEPEIGSLLALVSEVDAVLGKVEPDYAPDVLAVKGPVNRAIDVPGIVPDEYSRKVLAYCERVKTTATPEELENVRAVNAYRMMMGRHALKIHERLLRAARGHSIHMEANGEFAHESSAPGLTHPGDRARRQGYGGGVGENIARGPGTGREAFDGWFHSSGHHRNMLGRGWTEMACGRSHGFWTQLFGGAGGKSLDDPEPLPPPTPDVAPVPDAPPPAPAEGAPGE